MKSRSRLDIIAMILESAQDKKTKQIKIAFKAYLNYDQLKEYLPFLLESDLISYERKERAYITTKKGNEFLEKYKQLKNMIDLPLVVSD